MFLEHELVTMIQKVNDSYQKLTLERHTLTQLDVVTYEKQFCSATGWFAFYNITIKRNSQGQYKITDIGIKDQVADANTDRWFEELQQIAKKKEQTGADARRKVQLVAFLESAGWEIEEKNGSYKMKIDRPEFHGGVMPV